MVSPPGPPAAFALALERPTDSVTSRSRGKLNQKHAEGGPGSNSAKIYSADPSLLGSGAGLGGLYERERDRICT